MVRQPPGQGGAGNRRRVRALTRGLRPRAAAVLPAVRAARTIPAVAAARRHGVWRHGTVREKGGSAVEGRQGYLDLYRLCRPGLAALLARAQPAAAERGLCRNRDRG